MGLNVLKNVLVFSKDGFESGEIAWEDGGDFADPSSAAGAALHDGGGCVVIPGLCDIHLHGSCGEDMSDGSPEGLMRMAAWEACHGTTSFCPATMTVSKGEILKAMASAREFSCNAKKAQWLDGDGAPIARLAGIYMEGPFISRAKCGAQDPSHVMPPSPQFLDEACSASGGLVRFCVLAPEEAGAMELAASAASRGIRPCIGHTACSYAQALDAISRGACELTHMFNAMPPMLHRAPGPIPAAALNGASAELIADGIHIENPMIAMAFRIFGPSRIILISDSMRAAGMADGTYTLGGQEVFVRGREARLSDGTLAGSASCLFDCLKNAVLGAKIPLCDAVAAAAVNPRLAAGIGFDFATPGSEASFIVATPPEDGLKVRRIVVRGRDCPVAAGL
ncbi:MAG: N-acetylglucosamine-6-phosphate deacetylase [Succinivibrio sp.]